MKSKKNQHYFISLKLDSKIAEQLFFYTNNYLQNNKLKMTVDLLFNNFTYLNIKLLICCLFVLDQFIGCSHFLLKLAKYRIKREKRTALTVR